MKATMKTITLVVAILVFPAIGFAAHAHREKWYQDRWCDERGGQLEVTLPDSTRIDCLTENNAIEFDFAKKWAEGLGQALHYGALTGKRAGVVLILENPKDQEYFRRLKSTVERLDLPVDVWTTKWAKPSKQKDYAETFSP